MGRNLAAAMGGPHTPPSIRPLLFLSLLAAMFSTSISAPVQDAVSTPGSSSSTPGWQGGSSGPVTPVTPPYNPTIPSSSSPPLHAYSVPVPGGGYRGPALPGSGSAGDGTPAVLASSSPDQPPPQQQPSTVLTFDLGEGVPCSLNPATDPEPTYCESDMVCYPQRRAVLSFGTTSGPSAPYSTSAAAAAPGTQPDATGFCAEPHPGVILPRAYPTPWPTPVAYYPLSKDLDSFPGGQLSGTSHRTAFDSTDRRWGGTLTCDAGTASFAALQPPPGFGQKGRLAVSVWVKLPAEQDGTAGGSEVGSGSSAADEQGGGAHRYVLSMARAGTTGSATANQVSILIPRPGHPKFGTVRAVMRDGDDATMPETFLDSDGTTSSTSGSTSGSSMYIGSTMYSSSGVLQYPKPADNPNVVDVWDGEWHHVVVSTIPPEVGPVSAGFFSRASGRGRGPIQGSGVSGWQVQRGYRLFVDGVMRAEMRPEDDSTSEVLGGVGGSGEGDTIDGDDSLYGGSAGQGGDEVSGGDASTLDGPIYLCSRADRDPLLFFTGQLAQLQLYGEALSPAAVSSLFMEFRRQALIYPQGEILHTGGRASVRNTRCLLPLSYAGQLQYQCLVLPHLSTSASNPGRADASHARQGGPACLTGPRGDWELCGDSSRSTNPLYVSAASGADAAAVAAVLDVAVDIDGSGASAEALNISSSDSSEEPTDSISTAASGSEEGASSSTLSAAVQARLAAAVGSTVYSYSPYLPRYTMSGQACMTAPYWLAGKLVQAGQCATVGGQEVCPVPKPHGQSNSDSTTDSSVADHYDLLQCDLMIAVPAASTFCYLAAEPTLPADLSALEDSDSSEGTSSSFEEQYSSMQTTARFEASQKAALLFEGCVSQGGLEFCKVRGQGGPWLLCPAGFAPAATLGTPCQLPFRYGSTSRSDCVAPMPDTASILPSGLSSNTLYCPIDKDSTGGPFTSTDDMQVCRRTTAFTASTLEASARSNPVTAPWASSSSVLRDPTAPVPGLQASQAIPLHGLVSARGSGARRYSLFTKQACMPLPAASLAVSAASTSSASTASVSALGRRGGASAVDGASAAASPSSGEASCIANADRGQFECRTAAANSAGAVQSSSSDGGVSGQWQVCAPVARSTISGNRCLLPFKWQGALRDDCIWHNGMEVCPVLATTATAADGALSAEGDAHADSALFPPQPSSHDFSGSGPGLPSSRQAEFDSPDNSTGAAGSVSKFAAVAAAGPWRWEQCSKDYATLWDQPPLKHVSATRLGLSAAACVFPFVHQGLTQWTCMNSSTSGTSSSSSTSSGGTTTTSSSNSSTEEGSTTTTIAKQVAKVLTDALGVCPLATGGWDVCAPRANITRYTFSGALCNLPFAHEGKLHYNCLGAANGTAGLCKDAAGTWHACVALHRKGKTSGKPCILPATISARDGFVSRGGITTDSSSRDDADVTGDAGDDAGVGEDAGSGSTAGSSAAGDTRMLMTDCIWQPMGSSGSQAAASTPEQQQEASGQYREVCYTDAETLEECTPSGRGLTGPVTLRTRSPGSFNQLATSPQSGGLRAAAPSPTASSSRVMSLAVGIAVGIGGTLLLLVVLATVAVKRGLVYQWRSNRFHEMQLDPELPGHDSSGFSRGGAKLAAGFTATKDWMAKPWGSSSSHMQGIQGEGSAGGDAAPAGPFDMPGAAGEVTTSPSKRMKLTPFAAVSTGLSGAGSLLHRLLSSGSSTGPSSTLLPPGSSSSSCAATDGAPIPTAAGSTSTGTGQASSSKGSPGSPSSPTSSSSSSSGGQSSRHHCMIELQSSKSISSSNSARSPVKGAAGQGIQPAAAAKPTNGDVAGSTAAAGAAPVGTAASPTAAVTPVFTSTNPFYEAAAADAAGAAAAAAAAAPGNAMPPFSAHVTAVAPAREATGSTELGSTLNPFSADAVAFDASQRPCYQSQLTGVSMNAAPAAITAAAGSGKRAGKAPSAAAGEDFGVDGAVGNTRRSGAVGLGSVVGARILQLAGTGVSRRAGPAGSYAAWDGGKTDGSDRVLPEADAGAAARGGGAGSDSEVGDADADGGESATATAAGAAAAAAAGKKGVAGKLSKVLHPIATRQREEVEAAKRVGREVAAAAAANPPGASGGNGLL